MLQLPLYVYLLFAACVITAAYIVFSAIGFKKPFVITMLSWIALQSILGLSGFYTVTNAKPPRFPLLFVPPLLFLLINLFTVRGRKLLDSFNIKTLTLLHLIRIPVEIVLYWLFVHKAIPELMTFEGRNFDIISGLTAPFIYYFGFIKKSISKQWLIIWNITCLLLLINVVVNSVLSASTPLQMFAFDQPNIAVGFFPFMLLPSFIVPMVILAHLVTIRQLSISNKLKLISK